MKFYCFLIILIVASISLASNLQSVYADDTAKTKKDPFPHVIVTMPREGINDHLVVKLTLESIDVQTKYGKLTVPIKEIETIIPGLKNHPEYLKSINLLVLQLSNNSFKRREEAQKNLIKEGSKISTILKAHLAKANEDDFDAELKTRLDAILEDFDSSEDESADSLPLIEEDQIFTTTFMIKGRILTRSFDFKTNHAKSGKLTIPLKRIKKMQLTKKADMQLVSRTVLVKGDNFHQKNILNTGIMIRKGDKIEISASGEIELTPWGNKMKSTPDGHRSVGTLNNTNIFYGTLVCYVGNSRMIQVGSKNTWEATHSGKMKLGVLMYPQYTRGNYKFPGEYKVKIMVMHETK